MAGEFILSLFGLVEFSKLLDYIADVTAIVKKKMYIGYYFEAFTNLWLVERAIEKWLILVDDNDREIKNRSSA